jgi:hypothetical protein
MAWTPAAAARRKHRRGLMKPLCADRCAESARAGRGAAARAEPAPPYPHPRGEAPPGGPAPWAPAGGAHGGRQPPPLPVLESSACPLPWQGQSEEQGWKTTGALSLWEGEVYQGLNLLRFLPEHFCVNRGRGLLEPPTKVAPDAGLSCHLSAHLALSKLQD